MDQVDFSSSLLQEVELDPEAKEENINSIHSYIDWINIEFEKVCKESGRLTQKKQMLLLLLAEENIRNG